MSLNNTPSSERLHIGIFGKTNSGKSSLINAITNQNIAIVSNVKGTTTDPVYKSMELLPLGPVTIIDTAGLDDNTELGILRTQKTKEVLRKTDIALLAVDSQNELSACEKELVNIFKENNINYIIVHNKSDLTSNKQEILNQNEIYVSALTGENINKLKELIANLINEEKNKTPLVSDLINKYDNVILVTPIDSAAPKGRIILPQQQVLRDLLEIGAITTVVREYELEQALQSLKNKPKLVITDSQAFKQVSSQTPDDIFLTSFSILFARYKGVLKTAVKGISKLSYLNEGDKILISEGCTHHRQCDDIGTVKLPRWIKEYTGKTFNYEFSSGGGFPNDLSPYKLIIHCGGCMLKEKEVLFRYREAEKSLIPITNYGITIAHINNILERSLKIFPDIYSIIKNGN